MRKYAWVAMMALTICGLWSAAQSEGATSAEKLQGAWSGSWEGGGAGGRFDLTLEKGSDGKPAGGVSVGQEAGDYTAKFSTVSIEGNKLSARYDYPPDGQAEVVLNATFANGAADGTWAMVAKGGDAASAIATGTWKVTKK